MCSGRVQTNPFHAGRMLPATAVEESGERTGRSATFFARTTMGVSLDHPQVAPAAFSLRSKRSPVPTRRYRVAQVWRPACAQNASMPVRFLIFQKFKTQGFESD